MLGRQDLGDFEHIEGSGEIGVGIGARIFEAVAHARLRREMDDDVRPRLGGESRNGSKILEHCLEAAIGRIGLENGGPRALEVDVVVGSEAIETKDHAPGVK